MVYVCGMGSSLTLKGEQGQLCIVDRDQVAFFLNIKSLCLLRLSFNVQNPYSSPPLIGYEISTGSPTHTHNQKKLKTV